MKNTDIERIKTIERLGSISKAADELYISRSALTQFISQFEAELGFALFDRSHKGIKLTPQGQYFLDEASKCVNAYDRIVKHCRSMRESGEDFIVIGSMHNLDSPYLPVVCREFSKRYPGVDIQFKDYNSNDFIQKFIRGDFDVAAEYFANYVHDILGVKTEYIATVRQNLQVPVQHPLSGKKSIGFEDLRGYTLLMYKEGITKSEDALRAHILKYEPDIRIIDIDSYDSTMYTKCELESAMVVSYTTYDQSFSSFVHIPVTWDIPVNLGFCSFEVCRQTVKDFMALAGEIYRNACVYDFSRKNDMIPESKNDSGFSKAPVNPRNNMIGGSESGSIYEFRDKEKLYS